MFKRVLFIASLLFSISFTVKAVALKAYIKNNFRAANNCTYQIFNFQDSSLYTGTNKSKLKYNWYFGDGTTDTGKSVTKHYTATGTYTLKLVVTPVAADGIPADSTTKTVTIDGNGVLPVLNYTGFLCERSEVSFSIKSTFTNTAYNTNFGDGNNVGTPANYNQAAATPGIHVYQTRGPYLVTVRDSNSAGCKSQITVPITILQRPFARQPTTLKGLYHCQDSSLTFNVVQNSISDTLGMRVTYKWEFPDGTTYTTKSVTKLFKDSGNFYGKLFVINNSGTGCSDSVTKFNYTVYSNPTVKFYMVPHCQDSIAKIYDSSVTHFSQGGLYSWDWAFYDSNFVRLDTADGYKGYYSPDSFFYGFPHGGTFYVTEYVKTTDGCFDSLQKKVYVYPTPTANFGFRNTCVDSALQFTDSSTVPKGNTVTGWSWDFGDDSVSRLQNPAHMYAASGYNYSVRLIAKTRTGCIDSVRKTVVAYPLPVASFVYTSQCQGVKVPFGNSSNMPAGTNSNDNVSRGLWLFGDGTPNDTTLYPQHAFIDSGFHNVKLVAYSSHGCPDTVSQNVYIYPSPKPSFFLKNDCERDSVHFINTSKAYHDLLIDSSYTWNFGDTTPVVNTVINPPHLYQHSDTFNVTLTAKTWTHQCSKDTTIPVVIIPGPHSSFTVGPKCTGSPVPFTNTTYSQSPLPIKYLWNFGDGTYDTTKNPLHIYTKSLGYRVRLTSYMPATGCTDSTSLIYVPVTPRPVVYFSANNACSDSIVTCTDSSYVPGYKPPQQLQSWTWDFGDGHFASGQTVTHQYSTPGVYTIREYVLSNSDCEDSFIRKVTIFKVPKSNFTYTESCAGTPTQFTSLTTPADSVATWEWVFSEDANNTVVAKDASHIYHDNDILDASLTVITANGCPNTKGETVNIYYSPVSLFTNTVACNTRQITFTSSYTGQPPAPNFVSTWEWNFGDTALDDRAADTSSTQNPAHTFEYAGKYNVVLKETSNQGCISTDTQVVTVPILPIAGFTYTGSCVGRQFVFVDTSIDKPASSFPSFPIWDFGDGNTGQGVTQNVNIYARPGTYTAKMVELADYTSKYPGLRCISDTAYTNIVVNPLPLPKFITDTACFGNATTFYDSSQANGGYISHYNWKFGDGTQDSIKTSQFTHTYSDSFQGNNTTYPVILKITTNYGCDSSDTQKVFIRQVPYTSFTASPDPAAIQHSQVTFTNTTLHADSTHYYWTFGDGTDSHDISPTHTYKDTGTYLVTLSADNDYCVDTFRYIVYITPGYTLYAPNCITANGDNKNDGWMAKGVGVINFDVVIVDRWGQIVFHSEDMNKPWNADYNGNGVKVPEGVYKYYIKAGDFSQTNYTTLQGNITVLR